MGMESWGRIGILCCGLALASGPAGAVTQAFFTSQESVEKELVRLIDNAYTSIDMALFRFASRPLAQALARARVRGVRIRLILDGHPEAERGTEGLGMRLAAVEVRRLDGKRGGTQGIMHHKFVLFDQGRVVTGSFNWTAGAEHANYENAILTDNAGVVAAYGREFERLWSRATPLTPGFSSFDSPEPANPAGTHRRHSPWKLTVRAPQAQTTKQPASSPVRKKHRRRKKKT